VPRLDTIRSIETPEGVVLELPVAGPLPRALAWCLDMGLRGAVYTFFGGLLGAFGDTGMGLLLLLAFLLEWFYPVAFELLRSGQTPGKSVMGLAVVMADGTPVRPAASVLRNLLRFADFLPAGYLVGVLSMVVDPGFRRLGDLSAGTLVVHRRPPASPRGLPAAPPLAVPLALRPEEQRAIVAFAGRCPTWSEERQEELAEVLEPLAGRPPAQAVRRLHGMARWLQGER